MVLYPLMQEQYYQYVFKRNVIVLNYPKQMDSVHYQKIHIQTMRYILVFLKAFFHPFVERCPWTVCVTVSHGSSYTAPMIKAGESAHSERVLWELIFPFAVEQQIELKHINTQINCLDRYNDYPD